MHMSTSRPTGPATPRERPCGQYKIHPQGNSLSVTVPETSGLTPGTALSMRRGWYDDQLLYLKAVPATAPSDARAASQPTPIADGGEQVTETSITAPYTVRTADPPMMTIPAEEPPDPLADDTEPLAENTYPVLVAGRVAGSLAYLKVIPEALYTAAGSIAISDHIQHVTTAEEPPAPSAPSSQATFADFHD